MLKPRQEEVGLRRFIQSIVERVLDDADYFHQRGLRVQDAYAFAQSVLFAAIEFAGIFLIDDRDQRRVAVITFSKIAPRKQRRPDSFEIPRRDDIGGDFIPLAWRRISLAFFHNRPY